MVVLAIDVKSIAKHSHRGPNCSTSVVFSELTLANPFRSCDELVKKIPRWLQDLLTDLQKGTEKLSVQHTRNTVSRSNFWKERV